VFGADGVAGGARPGQGQHADYTVIDIPWIDAALRGKREATD
jgi:hypothetical protein